ncbi:MAG: hybrid sensor histidine kinase/response regulator, partial [Planctomycetaceae bacterium]
VLSHELRTPLTPALASVNYIEAKPDLDPELRRQITMIRRNVEMEARLIDDLLDLTRISRGKIELHPEALDAHASLRRALEICHNDIEEKRLELTLGLWAERHFIWGDPARMQQVFWNLINNAVKFTPKGGRISLRTANVADGRFELVVRDTGVGIEPEAIPRIFNAFEQGERTVTRQFGGLGLGLAITKTLVEMHEGTLVAESEGPGRGATFRLTLGTIEQSVEDMKNPPASRSADHRPLRILLVDDHEDTLQMMASLLGLYGHEVQTAANVRDALDLADRDPFDLLISDIGLPDGSGLDIIRQVRRTRGIKGIALSGFGMEEDLRRSREAGFDRHLTKPVDLHTLEEAIQQVAS